MASFTFFHPTNELISQLESLIVAGAGSIEVEGIPATEIKSFIISALFVSSSLTCAVQNLIEDGRQG